MGVRAPLPHGAAAKGPPECEIAAPWGPWQREIQSVKLRRLPWGSRLLCLSWGGSSLGRRRANAQALPLPACATHPQTTPLLQNTLPKSPQPLACPSRAAPCARRHGPQPDGVTSSAFTLPQPTAPNLGHVPNAHPSSLAGEKPPQHPPVPTAGFPVPRSLQDPIPGPQIRLGWKIQKRTGGEKSAGVLRFPL